MPRLQEPPTSLLERRYRGRRKQNTSALSDQEVTLRLVRYDGWRSVFILIQHSKPGRHVVSIYSETGSNLCCPLRHDGIVPGARLAASVAFQG